MILNFSESLGECRQLRLPLRIRSRDDEPQLFVKNADVPLAIEIELVGLRLRADDARKANSPRTGFADSGGHAHQLRVRCVVVWDRFGGTVVQVKRVLRDAPERFE